MRGRCVILFFISPWCHAAASASCPPDIALAAGVVVVAHARHASTVFELDAYGRIAAAITPLVRSALTADVARRRSCCVACALAFAVAAAL